MTATRSKLPSDSVISRPEECLTTSQDRIRTSNSTAAAAAVAATAGAEDACWSPNAQQTMDLRLARKSDSAAARLWLRICRGRIPQPTNPRVLL